ncbi:MAG TPA: OsmC family protein [Cyclobacteriaceae bacterium]|nr:OsmC family protein [Cyclobacteriaceae bacterium]
MEPHFYTVDIDWSSDRKGMMCSPELNGSHEQCIQVATPPEFPKGIPGIWSPEHLFTAAVSSCLMTTFLAIAENSKLDFISFRCGSKGKLERIDGKYAMTEIELTPKVVVKNAADIPRALKVLEKSEAGCLISNSVKARVTMSPLVEAQAKAA